MTPDGTQRKPTLDPKNLKQKTLPLIMELEREAM